jgi:hypothetical protein
LKRELKSDEMIEDHSKRPDVRLEVIRLISPDLRRCEVRGSCLSVKKPIDAFFRYIQVSNLHMFLAKENIGRF